MLLTAPLATPASIRPTLSMSRKLSRPRWHGNSVSLTSEKNKSASRAKNGRGRPGLRFGFYSNIKPRQLCHLGCRDSDAPIRRPDGDFEFARQNGLVTDGNYGHFWFGQRLRWNNRHCAEHSR